MVLCNTGIFFAQNVDIVGRWIGTEADGTSLTVVFDSKGFITVYNETVTFGGESFEVNGYTLGLKYETAVKSNLHIIDFIMYDRNNPEQNIRKTGSFKLIDKNTLELKNELFNAPDTPGEELTLYTLKREP